MVFKKFSLLLILVAIIHVLNGQFLLGPRHGKVVFCYLATWSVYYEDTAKFEIKDIDPSLCTHIVYCFAGLDEDTMSVKVIDPGLDIDNEYENNGYKAFVSLKRKYPHLKVMIAIGGWNEGSLKFSNMAASETSRSQFIKSVLEFLDTYKFDGIDMHWKYPNVRDGKRVDKDNFITLMKELRQALKPRRHILTAAIGAPKYVLVAAYDLPQLNKYVDMLIVLTYDYYGSWDEKVGANAPLDSVDKEDVYSIDYTLKYLISHGISSYKIVLGVPMFGRTFILQEPEIEVIEFGRTSAMSEGFQGPYTKEDGFMAYSEICMELTKNEDKWTRYWDEQSSTPYLRSEDRIITYDNARSIAIKIKKAIEYNLAGVMAYSIDADDFSGICEREPDYVSVSFSGLYNFIDTFNRISKNQILQRYFQNLKTQDAQALGSLNNSIEIMNKNHLWITDPKPTYPLLRAIDESINLAIEEKILTSDMIGIVKRKTNSGYSAIATNSVFPVVCYFCYI